jgi:hypothetical protein
MLRSAGGRWAWAAIAVSAFLLLSMGGAIVAAPLTLPVLYVIVRCGQCSPRPRAAAVVVAALTVAEVAWAATYLAIAEAGPWIWLLPVAAGAGTAAALARTPTAVAVIP